VGIRVVSVGGMMMLRGALMNDMEYQYKHYCEEIEFDKIFYDFSVKNESRIFINDDIRDFFGISLGRLMKVYSRKYSLPCEITGIEQIRTYVDYVGSGVSSVQAIVTITPHK